MKKCLIFICVFGLIAAVFSKYKKESIPVFATDAERFKYEYEAVNGKHDKNGMKIRTLSIAEDNPIIYASYIDIVQYMERGESFGVYFGYAECPWCRSCIEAILESALECGIDSVYYVDIHNNRDVFEIKNGNVIKTQNGEDGYSLLLSKLENVLSDYILYDTDDKEYKVGEKRIYAPNLIIVKDGTAVKLAKDDDLFEDPYGDITEEMYQDMKEIYMKTFSVLKEGMS